MKNHLFFLLLFSLVFIAACEDDDGSNDPMLPIQVRLVNNTEFLLTTADFRFDWEGNAPGYQEYGPLSAGVTTEYKGFAAGGDCSLNFLGSAEDGNQNIQIGSLCNCVCQLDEGQYTLSLDFVETPEGGIFQGNLEAD